MFLAAVQDYLFSNAYVKSDGKVNFPNTRAQGYVWFNNRIYGHEPGVIYDETNMWPWLEEGTITVSSKQIDWVAGRTEGRADGACKGSLGRKKEEACREAGEGWCSGIIFRR